MAAPFRLSSTDDAAAWIAEQAQATRAVYVAGCSGDPLAIADAFQRDPDRAAGLTFFGIWIPGVNRTDWSALSSTTRAESIFVSRDWASSFQSGAFRFKPLSYSQAWRWIASRPCDVAVLQVSPPNEAGLCSFGPSADFSPAFVDRSVKRLGVVNAAMPAAQDGPSIRYDAFDAVVEINTPLATLAEPALDPAFKAIGGHIAELIKPGDTLQFGLGKVQSAVIDALRSHSGLRLHSGMAADPFTDLLDGDVFDHAPGAITIGVATGSAELYSRTALDPRVRFAPVEFTHAHANLAAIDNFVAINSVMEIDLLGQCNAEFLDGRQISGAGGLVDFLRGAGASRGGRPIVALPASAKSGTRSRIAPRLSAPAIGVSRADVGLVVTENGVADLRELDIDGRAEALIAIAAPAHQDALSAEWRQIRKGL